MPIDKWNDRYFELGVEYYISGRLAVLCHNMVAGNLLHHALEMFLKAVFRESMTPVELRDTYSHRLRDLWPDFKILAADARLDGFDPLVAELDPWDEIRYPDFVEGDHRSRVKSLDLIRSDVRNKPMKVTKYYHLNLEDFDELFEALVAVMHVGRRYLWMSPLGGRAGIAYREENRHVIATHD
jgi:hypothetical protein